jgi:hypothetical protein
MIDFLLDTIYGVTKFLAWNAIYFIITITVYQGFASGYIKL